MHILYNIIYITVDSVQRVRCANIVLSGELIKKKNKQKFFEEQKKEKKQKLTINTLNYQQERFVLPFFVVLFFLF